MPVVHHSHKQIHLKVVYYGPGLGGKTTNLKFIHAHTRPELRGKLLSLNTETERTLFFDLLPVELGDFRGYGIRLHLCTVPGQIAYDKTRQLVLRHVDGVVFVADSQESVLDSNIEAVTNLETNLALLGEDPTRLPLVVQYNKRDLPSAMPIYNLRSQLGIPDGVPEIEAVAREGIGVIETMKQIVKSCLSLLGDPSRAPNGRSPSILPGQRASMFPGGKPAGMYGEGSGELLIPPAPNLPRFEVEPADDEKDPPGPYRLKWERTA
jgi:mutual gliding-motility protein MglA